MQSEYGPYVWMDEYCLARKGVTRDYQPDWTATRYFVGGKMFGMVGGDRDGRPLISLKLEPAFSDLLRSQYPGVIVPGYYLNKVHWSSLYIDGQVPAAVLRDMLDNAYAVTFAGLTRKARQAIEAEAV